MSHQTPQPVCPVCHDDCDPEDLVDHWTLGPCCYGCACRADFPSELDNIL